MNGNTKKIQIVLCLLAGVGMFLPLYVVSGYGKTVRVTFMEVFDAGELEGIINGKIILGAVIISLIILFTRLKQDTFSQKIISLIVIIISGILFYIDVDKIAAIKSLFSAMMSNGVGYYISLLSFVGAIIIGIIDIFNDGNIARNEYPVDYNQVINNYFDDGKYVNKTSGSNVVDQVEIMKNNVAPPPKEETLTNKNAVKLSDLVGNNQDNQSNIDNNSINN